MAEIIISHTEVTRQMSPTVTAKAYAETYIEYTVTDTADTATITASVKGRAGSSGGYFTGAHLLIEASSINSDYFGSWRLNNDTIANFKQAFYTQTNAITFTTANKTASITKTHVAQSIPVWVNFSMAPSYWLQYSGSTGTGGSNKKNFSPGYGTFYIPIGAKASYEISYNANGGSSSPTSQTKWHNESLQLTSATPKKDGYTFKGWATSVDRASAGTVDYAIGSTYPASNNSSATLYAVWELAYIKPTIQNITVERCTQNGVLDDDGDYALVSFDWAIFKTSLAQYYGGSTAPYTNNSVSNCTATVGTRTATKALTGASGTASVVVGNGTFDSDIAYAATVSITDSQTVISDHTTTVSGTLPTQFFPLDFNADASAVGFFMPAPNDGSGAYFGRDIYVYVETGTTSGTDGQINQALTNLGWTNVLS